MSPVERSQLIEEVGAAMIELQGALDQLDRAAADLLAINQHDLRCLGILFRLGPMTAGRLAAESGLTPGAVTALIDRLERAGYARRARGADDRRVVLVELTPEAERLADEAYGEVAARGRERLEALTTGQLTTLRDLLRASAAIQAEGAERLRAPRP